MDLYAQPIPPEMALHATPRVNLKEALLQRLSQVQLQKQRETRPDSEALEKGMLLEMLEKAQKMQAVAQANWTKEKEDLLSQIRRLQLQSRRPSGDFRKDPRSESVSLRQQTESLPVAKLEDKPKAAVAQKPDKQLQAQLRAMEKRAFELEKSLDEKAKALEETRFLYDERNALIESLEEQLAAAKKRQVRESEAQTERGEAEELRKALDVMEERAKDLESDGAAERERSRKLGEELAGVKDVVAQQTQVIALLKSAKSATSEVTAVSDVPSAVNSFLASFEEQEQRVVEAKLELEGLAKLLNKLEDNVTKLSQPEPVSPNSAELTQCKGLLAAAYVCVKALQEIVRELVNGAVDPEQGMLDSQRAEIDLLRKEKELLEAQLVRASSRDVTQLLAQLEPVTLYVSQCAPSLESLDTLRQAEAALLSSLKDCIRRMSAPAESHTCTHTEQIEAMSTSLKSLQVDFAEYRTKVSQDKAKFAEQLFKIAESLEYRKDLWEQLQTLEADENHLERLSSLSEELERQTEWETENLALLISWMRDGEEEKTEKPRRSIATIPEEEEDEEEEERE